MRIQNIAQIKPFFLSYMLPVLLFGIGGFSHAQSKSEVSLYVKARVSKLDYEVLQRKNDIGNGGGFGARYAYYFSENWSLGSGLEYQNYQGTAKIGSLQDAYQHADMEGEAFEFRYTATDYKERQYASYLNVPLTVQYETSGTTKFYISGGAKVGFNLTSEYEATATSLVTSGYYEQYDAELHAPEFAGFGDFGTNKTQRSQLDLKASYLATLETGVKFPLEPEWSLYLGLFIDYGLNGIGEKEGQGNVIEYHTENPSAFSGNSLLSAVNKSTGTAYTEEVKLLAYGLKIRYAFGL